MTSAKSINVSTWLDESKLNRSHIGMVVLCCLIMTIDGYNMFVYGGTVPLLLKAFHIGPAEAGLLGSCSLFGAAVGALVFGSLADKIGRKTTIISCLALFCVAQGVIGFTNGPVPFGIFRVICGIGVGGTLPNVVALASEFMPRRNRSWGVAGVMAGMPLGAIVAPGISMWLLPLYGWRSVYYVSFIPLLLVPVALKWLPESPIRLVAKNRLSELRILLLRARPLESLPAEAIFEVNKGSGKAPFVDLFREHRGFSTVLFWLVYFVSLLPDLWPGSLAAEADDE